MRKALCALLAALATTAVVIGVPATPAAGAGLNDAAVAVVGVPDEVSPPGGVALYRVTASNTGALPLSSVTLTDTTTGGTVDQGLSTAPGCSFSGNTVTCTFSLASGQSRTIEVAVQTPLTAGSVTNTASVQVQFLPVDDDSSNDQRSVTTPVVADPDRSVALVRGGQSIAFKTHSLSVPAAVEGVITSLSVAEAEPGLMCGTQACGDGLHVDFVDHPRFRAVNPAQPLVIALSFGQMDPCRGLGNNECTGLWFRKTSGETPQLLPDCTTSGVAAPAPCLNAKFKQNGDIHYRVLGLSTDPELLPPIRL
jgi:hypothetical protein